MNASFSPASICTQAPSAVLSSSDSSVTGTSAVTRCTLTSRLLNTGLVWVIVAASLSQYAWMPFVPCAVDSFAGMISVLPDTGT